MDRTIMTMAVIASVFVILFSVFMIITFSKKSLPDLNINRYQEANKTIENITEDVALEALRDANYSIENMKDNNFSINYVSDLLIQAKNAYEKAKVAEEIKAGNTSLSRQVKHALGGLNYSSFSFVDSYDKVVDYTNKIEEAKNKAFSISDSIRLFELSLEEYKIDLTEIHGLIDNAKISLKEERYDEAQSYLDEANSLLNKKKEEFTLTNSMINYSKGFFVKYWMWILIFSVFLALALKLSWNKIMIVKLINEIKRMKKESNILNELMKKAQTERFKQNKISGLVYNIRMKKYKERIDEIKEKLPVLEAELKRRGK